MNMKRKPKAPGEVLETQFMQPNQITQKELASHTGWTRKHVNELCKGKARVTIDTALILGKAFGTGPDYWLELQQAVDIWDALHSEKRKERLESIVPLMKMLGVTVSDFDIPGRVDFSISEAQWLADLHGIENDLRDTDKLCTKSLALMRPMPTQDEGAADWLNDSWLAGELSFAAVIKYGRTFGSGVRSGIPVSWINQLPDTYKASHKYFKDIRDKFVAHSVNAFEDNQVFAYLSPQFAPVEVSSITVDTGRFVSLSSEDLLNLKSLAGALKQLVQQEIAVEKSRVLGIARSLPLADLLARETDNRPLPSAEDVGKRRPRA